jgi:hypothetical protein
MIEEVVFAPGRTEVCRNAQTRRTRAVSCTAHRAAVAEAFGRARKEGRCRRQAPKKRKMNKSFKTVKMQLCYFYSTMLKPPKLLLKILYYLWLTVKGLFLLYAVVFSIAGTIALCLAFQFVMTPLRQVKALRTSNPKETVYMTRYRAERYAPPEIRTIGLNLNVPAEHRARRRGRWFLPAPRV